MPPLLLRPAFALLALIIACGSGGDTTAPNNPPAGSNLPAELVGEWHYQQIGDQNCSPDTGQCVPTSNQSETVTLASNVHFEHVFVGESNFPPCSMEAALVRGYGGGTGLQPVAPHEQGNNRVTNTAAKARPATRRARPTPTWELSNSDGAPQLTLTNDRGTAIWRGSPPTCTICDLHTRGLP
jgi:hypothetical protein